MLTVITGTPGAGKSLYAVWEFARHVPGSTVEADGVAVPRRLLSNIKDLLIEHQHITAADLERWHEWAQPGDVILFDEVQEVWRPRGLGTKVPDAIAALETHRHKGVDIILVTQHPMLVDPNIRRLVNQHLHLRRLSRTVAYVYEWDHCSNPGMTKTALQSKVWFHPKKAYDLYKSAQLHTKPTARMPRLGLLALAALAGLAYVGPMAYARITERMGKGEPVAQSSQARVQSPARAASGAARSEAAAPPAAPPSSSPIEPAADVKPAGCMSLGDRCTCFDRAGDKLSMDLDECREASRELNAVSSSRWSAAQYAPKVPFSLGETVRGVGGVTPDGGEAYVPPQMLERAAPAKPVKKASAP